MPKILIVDDEEIILLSLKKVLEKEGHEVVTACDGVEALEILSNQNIDIDVVFLDIGMPNLGGIEVLRAMNEMTIKTKAIMLTGKADIKNAHRCFCLNAADFVSKPYDGTDIINVLEKVLKEIEAESEKQAISF